MYWNIDKNNLESKQKNGNENDFNNCLNFSDFFRYVGKR